MRTFVLLVCVVAALIVEVVEAERLIKVNAQLLRSKNSSNGAAARLPEQDELIENISHFLSSIRSNVTDEDLLMRAIQHQYATTSNQQDLQCLQDITTWTTDKSKFKLYALQMQDSWAQRQGGMLEGNVRWTGHYWECVNSITDNFSGKYCTTYYGFTYLPYYGGIPYDIAFDSCFPDSCSDYMIKMLTGNATSGDIRAPVLETTCSYEDKSFGGFEISILVISSILLLLACVGTTHDSIIRSKIMKITTRKWLLCFSVITNGEKILSTKKSPNNIGAINGIRTISTLWVILGHTAMMVIQSMDNVVVMQREVRDRFEMLVILNSTYCVDTFFIIGGLLTSYLTLKQLKKTKGKLNIPLMYLHRYLRLTPVYAYIVLFTVGLYKFLGTGPHWAEMQFEKTKDCRDDWWTNILYINNLYPAYNYCFGHSWYLACDMQFYILSPFFIYLIYKWPKVGISNTSVFTLVSIGITWWMSQSTDQQTLAVTQSIYSNAYVFMYFRLLNIGNTFDSFSPEDYKNRYKSDMYSLPWSRISVYLIGILTGYILYKTQRKIKMPKIVVFVGWLFAVGTALTIVYGVFGSTRVPQMMEVPVAAFYNAVSRPVWGICIAWVIVACTCGYGGPVNTFLDWSLFLPLSRMTYAVYLLHLYVIYWSVYTQEVLQHYSAVWLTYSYIGHVILAFLVAFLVTLLVEWPCQEILKILLPTGRRSSPQPPVVLENKPEINCEEKPPSYNSQDESFNLDEINKHGSGRGENNSAFEVEEETSTTKSRL